MRTRSCATSGQAAQDDACAQPESKTMRIADIKAAVEAGKTVHWANTAYHVSKDRLGQFHIKYLPNGSCIGLTNRAGTQLNGQPDDFFIAETTQGQETSHATC